MLDQLQELNSAIRECRSCRLGGLHSRGIPGRGNPHSPLMLVAEAPGPEEAKHGAVLIGPTGKELDKLLSSVGISMSDGCYLCNVCNCWPGPGNPDPKPEELEACRYWLDGAVAIIEPRVVVALGNIAIGHFLPGVKVGDVHGRPVDMGDYVLYPTYHPAAALHNPARMTQLLEDFARIPDVLAGRYMAAPELVDEYPEPDYQLLDSESIITAVDRDWPLLPNDLLVAVDTETDRQGRLWCWSYSSQLGTAQVVMADDLQYFWSMFQPPYTLVMHNATFDIGVIERAGVHITAPVEDTMLAAHVLEEERLGLKHLSKTLLGMEMQDYEDVVSPAQRDLALAYLVEVAGRQWPASPRTEEMSWDKAKGELKVHNRQPQNIQKKAAKIIADAMSKGADPLDRWKKIDQAEKAAVEEEIGPMPIASIEDVADSERWIRYSARDADSTLRLYHLLKFRLEAAE